ncbi:hypothetical protein B296_00002608 [Ensete ventricosum]|uniref:Uncharacterized protein n=1 Tax=Ensete ventricosum TaxID=4639 RepID=A0A427BB65_ENSVE|nr:hypothetical protein B296_00002608 [Ensete ventricosum]
MAHRIVQTKWAGAQEEKEEEEEEEEEKRTPAVVAMDEIHGDLLDGFPVLGLRSSFLIEPRGADHSEPGFISQPPAVWNLKWVDSVRP